jgi:hypothetical protein
MVLELRGIDAWGLRNPETPDDPECCCVLMSAHIGAKGSKGSDKFDFTVVTPKYLLECPETRWTRGDLFMPEFSWREVERMVGRLVSSISATSWEEAANKLSKYLIWEFENYQPTK